MSPRGAALAGVLLVGAHLSGCAGADEGAGDPTFVGRQACVPCHQRESAAYRGSDHDRALAVAAEETVLGDFTGASFTHGSTTYRFDRPDGRFVVTIEEEDAAGQELEVLYAVGFEPLQQYLVALPGGRLQRLGVSWDTRPPDEGGGRWFHVHGEEEVRRDDLLHWSRSSQNWNRMCAACHSTNVQKNYDPETRAYATSWSEIDVSCEACHGPASAHLAWADAGADGSGRAPGRGRGFAAGLPQTRDEACARCHSHRTRIAEDRPGGRFLDAYRISLPREPLYHADGAVREEVFVYGSFLQSRMYQAGVGCTDCHDPHTAGLRERDNALCTGCHEAGRYDGPGHSFHGKGSAGARCVGCHMPTTTFMGVDARRDHRFGTPRPGLSDGPNACLACHRGEDVPWVSARIDAWYGPEPSSDPEAERARAFRDADRAHPAAGEALIRIAGDPARPALVRAAALSYLGGYPSQDALTALARGASDPDPLVRSEAARALVFLRPDDRAGILGPLLRDPTLAVRFAAARALAGTSRELLSTEDRRWLDRALGEYESGMALSLDDPAANVELGLYHLERGRTREAETAYRRAIELEPAFAPAYVNLADLYRASGRDDEGLVLLREGVALAPRAASLRHSLGLLHVRAGRQDLARAELARAAELDPEGAAPYALAYALALGGEGRADGAVAVIEAALEHHPHDRELLLALTDLRRRAGDLEEAVGTVRRLMELYPDDERFHRLDRRLRDELTVAKKEGSR